MRRLGAAVLVLAAGCLLAGCRGPEESTPIGDAFAGAPVILISIDTLRSDRLPVYGYGGVETPAIDALARDGILFERAYSHYPLTLPAHVSLLTGLLPGEHGVRDNVGYLFEAAASPYLPRRLRELGYRTGAAVSAFVLRQETGLGAHFDFFEDGIETREGVGLGRLQRRGDETLRLTLEWLDGVEQEPFFLLFHIFEPHTPYEPPEPFASRYADPYDGEIAAADAVVGELVRELRERGIYDRAVVLLLSDHGEGLGDHGEDEHGILLYREAIQIPMILKLPGSRRAGERVEASVQLVDVAPTILELLGEAPEPRADGDSLLRIAAVGTDRPIYAETYYPRLHFGWSELFALIEGDLYYIEGPEPELYDLAEDFAQRHNLLPGERHAYARVRTALAQLKRPLTMPGEVDPETARKLAALGYLASGAAAPEGPLPSPQSRIHVLEDLQQAQKRMVQGDHLEAAELYRRILAENPYMQDAWEQKANALTRAGRLDEALEAYRRALEGSGGAAHVALGVARLYVQLGRLEEAWQHAEIAARTAPAEAHHQLAAIALARDDLELADSHMRTALEHRGSRLEPLLAAVEIGARRERLAEAHGFMRQVENELERRGRERMPRGFHYLRGDLLARDGDLDGAIGEFHRELEAYPDHLQAHSRLAVALALQGRPQQAVDRLRTMVESQESPAAYAEAVKTLGVLGDPRSAQALLRHALSLYPGNEQLVSLDPS